MKQGSNLVDKKKGVDGDGWSRQHGFQSCLFQALFLDTWLGTQTSIMSRDVPDIHGDRADFCHSVDRGDVIFYRFIFEGKRDFWLFGRPQPLIKPKKSKGPFFEKTNR